MSESSLNGHSSPVLTELDAFIDKNCGALADAYRLLLQQPGLNLEEFAGQLQCDEKAARAILDLLGDLALLQADRQTSIVAVSPIVAMQKLMLREHALLQRQENNLAKSYKALSSLSSVFADGALHSEREHFAERLADLPAVRRRLQEFEISAKEEMLSLTPLAQNTLAGRADSRPLDLSLAERGIRVQALYDRALLFEPTFLEYARKLGGVGGQVRLVPRLPMQLIVFDRQIAVVSRHPPDISNGALVIWQKAMVLALTSLFELHWAQGEPLPGACSPRSQCSPHERAILSLLAEGSKDIAVARELRTSVRTVRRVVAGLMARTNTNSRFALGVHSAANDWVSLRLLGTSGLRSAVSVAQPRAGPLASGPRPPPAQ
jgi:DNA-binding CsgD family transcriptional regulator